MDKIKKYAIGGRQFEQRRLVLAQTEQVKEFFGETFTELRSFMRDQEDQPAANQNRTAALSIVSLVGSRSTQLVAIVLREKGQPVIEKDLDELVAFFEDNLDVEVAAKVVSDFLALTPIASDLKALGTMATAIGGSGDDWLEDLLCQLAGGDLSQREYIYWTYGYDDIQPWLKYRNREHEFREHVIALCRGLGVRFEERSEPVKTDQQIGQYCNGNDLSECSAMFGTALAKVCSTCPN